MRLTFSKTSVMSHLTQTVKQRPRVVEHHARLSTFGKELRNPLRCPHTTLAPSRRAIRLITSE